MPDPRSAQGDPDSIRRAAHAILSEPQFRPPYVSPLERARDWVGRQLAKILTHVLGAHYTTLAVVLLAGIVVLLVVLVIYVIRHVGRDPSTGGIVVADIRRPPADWLAEAVACERRGDYRGALRARYRALVAELARRGLVEEVPGRTTGEYRRAVTGAHPAAAGDFGGATDMFESAMYGDGPAGADEAARIAELSRRVLVR